MKAAATGRPTMEAASTALLGDPLDFVFAEHFRQRKLCNLLERLALAEAVDARLTAEVLGFLQHDMVLRPGAHDSRRAATARTAAG
jgi:hypothetical protein